MINQLNLFNDKIENSINIRGEEKELCLIIFDNKLYVDGLDFSKAFLNSNSFCYIINQMIRNRRKYKENKKDLLKYSINLNGRILLSVDAIRYIMVNRSRLVHTNNLFRPLILLYKKMFDLKNELNKTKTNSINETKNSRSNKTKNLNEIFNKLNTEVEKEVQKRTDEFKKDLLEKIQSLLVS